jgi:hypothetical protein
VISLLSGHRPRSTFTPSRGPIMIAPEVRARLDSLLRSGAFAETGVGYSAFIDRACEAAETEYHERLTAKGLG